LSDLPPSSDPIPSPNPIPSFDPTPSSNPVPSEPASLIVDILPVLPQYALKSLNLGSTQVYKDFELGMDIP